MSITTFRGLLDWMDSQKLLAHVTRAVDPAYELTTVQRKMQSGPNLGLLFENVKGSKLRVACNIMSRREAVAASLTGRDHVAASLTGRGHATLSEGISQPLQQWRW